MKTFSRRDALKLASAAMVPLAASGEPPRPTKNTHPDVPVWEVFELVLNGPANGNPFLDVQFASEFAQGHRTVRVNGFYDGGGRYKVRFMPDTAGAWTYTTTSNITALSGVVGTFTATQPSAEAHGPVVVHNTHHFSYADGSPYFPFGTTCYAWIHQSASLQQQTLVTLKTAPYNKIRMCVFPKHYEYNHNEPEFYPFIRSSAGASDFTQFDPKFFQHLERRILDLQALGIEADLILFHPYDRWGYATMPPEVDERYLRYVIARLGAYRNVWWSMANEWDLMNAKTLADFDRLFHVLESTDAHRHLRSIHYSVTMYDYAKPWITHASLQADNFDAAPGWLAAWKKPVIFDEVKYEGNLNKRWGNISAAEMARRFWVGVIAGCYVTHGETYLPASDSAFNEDATPTLWWAHGGTLHGESSAQIALLRRLVYDTAPAKGAPRMGLDAPAEQYYLHAVTYGGLDGKQVETVIYYMDAHQPIWYEFPLPPGTFTAQRIDPGAGVLSKLPGSLTGKAKLSLMVKPFQAVRFIRVNYVACQFGTNRKFRNDLETAGGRPTSITHLRLSRSI